MNYGLRASRGSSFLFVLFLILGCSSSPQRSISGTERYFISGYLPESGTQKVYVEIQGDRIINVLSQAPESKDLVLETNSLILPGLIDMHGHLKYNVLPLWTLAKSQFLNRFEWRTKFPPYKDAVSEQMKTVKGDAVCAAVRWAELKAIAGGSIAIQGIGGDSKCAKGFGALNIEIPGEFGQPQKIRAMTDMILPDLIRSVYRPWIEPKVRAGKTYDQAYEEMLNENGVNAFVQVYSEQPHNLRNGLLLLLGKDFGSKAESAEALTAFNTLVPEINKYLAEKYQLKPKDIEKQRESMRVWLFGKEKEPGYLKTAWIRKKDNSAESAQVRKQALDFLGKGGVLTVAGPIRRYINMFELSVRQSALSYLRDPNALAMFIHLAEGKRSDPYNMKEWEYLKAFGLDLPGLVLIHAVGMDQKKLQEAAKKQISIVWSPFSNLLLYGETLDVAAAKKAKVNLAIGTDWTPTGSKNLLDELKLARRYLKAKKIQGITDRDLVEMATVNAAKALRLEGQIGCVARGCQANLLLIDQTNLKSIRDPYSRVVQAEQKDIDLVIVAGQPTYGNLEHLNRIAKEWNEKDPETIDRMNTSCKMVKGLRIAHMGSDYDAKLSDKDLRTVSGIETELRAHMISAHDPLTSCEDSTYTARFAQYIESELPKNVFESKKLRVQYRLSDGFNPELLSSEMEEDE